MALQDVPLQNLNTADDTSAPPCAESRASVAVSLSVSVSDDGEHCSARILVGQQDAADVETSQNWCSDHVTDAHSCRQYTDDPAYVVDALGDAESQSLLASPNTGPPAEPDSMNPWVQAEANENEHEKDWCRDECVDLPGKSPITSCHDRDGVQSRSSNAAVSPACDPHSQQVTQRSMQDRYDDSNTSSAGTPNEPAAEHSPYSQQKAPQADDSPCQQHCQTPDDLACAPEQTDQPTMDFLQERLQCKATEISELREEVRRLRESRLCIDALPSGRDSEDDTVCISAAELAAMKKDMEEQERLIAGYGEANRTAAMQVKALEARLKSKDAAMIEERAALERDIVRAVEAQKHRSADTADKLRRVLELEGQLAGVREQAEAKEGQLRHTLEVLRQEKRVLEDRVSVLDAQAVQEGDHLVQKVRDEMQTVKAQYEAHVAGLQEQLDWHVQKQAETDAMLREQEATIADLRARVQDIPTVNAAQQQVADLNQKVQELQRAHADAEQRQTAPFSPYASAHSPGRTEEDALHSESRRHHAKVAEVEAAAHTRYRALEKKYEQLMAASVEGGDAVAVAAHQEAQRLRQRVQTLQAILDAERGRRPSSGLAESSSTTLEDVTNTPRHSEDGAGGSRASQGLTKQWVRLRQQLAEARQTILAKDSLVSKLHAQLQQGQQRQDRNMQMPEGQLSSLLHEIHGLRSQLERQGEAQAELHSDVRAAHEARQRSEQACAETVRQAEAEAADLRLQVAQLTARQEASQVMVAAVQQASAAAAGALQEVRSQHSAELKRLSAANEGAVSAAAREAAAVEARKGSERCLQLEAQLGNAAHRTSAMEQELQELRHSKVWAPSAREIVALENQVRDMSMQLSNQRQQWLAVTGGSPPVATPLVGLRSSPSAMLSPAAQQMLSPGTLARSDVVLVDSSADVHTKIEYLQKQVDSVIEVAAMLQRQRREREDSAAAAQPSVAV